MHPLSPFFLFANPRGNTTPAFYSPLPSYFFLCMAGPWRSCTTPTPCTFWPDLNTSWTLPGLPSLPSPSPATSSPTLAAQKLKPYGAREENQRELRFGEPPARPLSFPLALPSC
jgi:hypothetical protein